MQVIKKEGGFPIKMWTDGVPVENAALEQLGNVSQLPFIHKHIAVMPDVHWGHGATVGSVIATHHAVVPAAVGVDIGCGMVAVKTSLKASQLPDNLLAVRSAIEAAVPHGRSNNGGAGDKGAWSDKPPAVLSSWLPLFERFEAIIAKHPEIAKSNSVNHLGTLGGGNHFIELCTEADSEYLWVMLHSGSRGVGGRIGNHFIALAKEDMSTWFINLPDADLAYIPEGTEHFADYIEAVGWAQDFARENRRLMLDATCAAIANTLGLPFTFLEEAIQCHHNYVSREAHFGENVIVTRKGAVRARAGELGIIPGSMGARSFIVRGKGNADSFHSCSHGAGRAMSRTEAKKRFTLEDHAAATAGVECKKDDSVLDETPNAYKNIDLVMAAQAELVDVVATLKQVLCVKG